MLELKEISQIEDNKKNEIIEYLCRILNDATGGIPCHFYEVDCIECENDEDKEKSVLCWLRMAINDTKDKDWRKIFEKGEKH